MTWTDGQWSLLLELLDKGWPGELDPDGAEAYRVLLDGTDPDTVVQGLRRLLHAGQRFRPSAAELLASAHRDPGQPTFVEAYRLIFGPRGVLRARPDQRIFKDAGERASAERQAAVDRAGEMHPLIAVFVAAQGVDRLRGLELDDPDYGPMRRRDLEAEWNRFVERVEERDIAVAALPVGDRGTRGLHAFDPLAVLERGLKPAAALPAGTTESPS